MNAYAVTRISAIVPEKIKKLILPACEMTLCACAAIAGNAPFAAAFFAANVRRRDILPALAAGCALGTLILIGFKGTLAASASCAIITLFALCLEFFTPRKIDISALFAGVAGIAVLAPGFLITDNILSQWCGIIASAGASAAFTYILRSGGARAKRAEIAMLPCAAICALSTFGIDASFIAVGCAAVMGICRMGVITGCLTGAALCLSGGAVQSAFTAVITGVMCDFIARAGIKNVYAASVMRCAALVMANFLTGGMWDVPLAASCLTCAAMPVLLGKYVSGLFFACEGGASLAMAVRRRDEVKLYAMKRAFTVMAEGCGGDMPVFGEEILLSKMRTALCTGCPEYAECWQAADSRAVKLFCQLMTSAAETGGVIFEDGEIPPEVMRLCRRGMVIPSRLGPPLADFAAQRHKRVRLMHARWLISTQFTRAAKLFDDLIAASRDDMRDSAYAESALRDAGVVPVGAYISRGGEITVETKSRWEGASLAAAAGALATMGAEYAAESVEGRVATFAPRGTLTAKWGISSVASDENSPSGDSCDVRAVGASKLIAVISDGMGSGGAARDESARVIELAAALIEADIPAGDMTDAINAVMLSRGGEEMFATADILICDMRAATGEFIKLSACKSYILRAARLMCVEGGCLPLGILEEVSPALADVQLRAGDILVMMTDGVADMLCDEDMRDILMDNSREPPEAVADAVIDAALARAEGRRDDMSCVCIEFSAA